MTVSLPVWTAKYCEKRLKRKSRYKGGRGAYPQALSEVVTLWDARVFVGIPSISTILTNKIQNRKREQDSKRESKKRVFYGVQLSALAS